MNFLDILAILVTGTLYTAAPLIFTALGGVFSERSGVVNIALEGLMLFGAFIGVVTTLLMGDTWGTMTLGLHLFLQELAVGYLHFFTPLLPLHFVRTKLLVE